MILIMIAKYFNPCEINDTYYHFTIKFNVCSNISGVGDIKNPVIVELK